MQEAGFWVALGVLSTMGGLFEEVVGRSGRRDVDGVVCVVMRALEG